MYEDIYSSIISSPLTITHIAENSKLGLNS